MAGPAPTLGPGRTPLGTGSACGNLGGSVSRPGNRQEEETAGGSFRGIELDLFWKPRGAAPWSPMRPAGQGPHLGSCPPNPSVAGRKWQGRNGISLSFIKTAVCPFVQNRIDYTTCRLSVTGRIMCINEWTRPTCVNVDTFQKGNFESVKSYSLQKGYTVNHLHTFHI